MKTSLLFVSFTTPPPPRTDNSERVKTLESSEYIENTRWHIADPPPNPSLVKTVKTVKTHDEIPKPPHPLPSEWSPDPEWKQSKLKRYHTPNKSPSEKSENSENTRWDIPNPPPPIPQEWKHWNISSKNSENSKLWINIPNATPPVWKQLKHWKHSLRYPTPQPQGVKTDDIVKTLAQFTPHPLP